VLTGGVIAAAFAVATVPVPGHAVGDHTAVLRAGDRSYASASCHPDRQVNITRPVEKAYRDPVRDAVVARHGDITGAWISDLRGVVTFKIDVKKMSHDTLVIVFDTNCDRYEDYLLGVWGRSLGGSVELDRLEKSQEFEMGAPTIVRTRSRRTVGAITFTFRFSSSRFGGTTAFRFWAWVDTKNPLGGVDTSDWAPDNHTYWYYDLLSR
jgi:hypothetical protein